MLEDNDEILADDDVVRRALLGSERPVMVDESSPLLGKAIDAGAGGVTETEILREWEHVSWWRRPSVSSGVLYFPVPGPLRCRKS